MYRLSQVMSTPVASTRSSRPGSEREYSGEVSSTCIFPSFACEYLDGDSPFECCSFDALSGSYLACRRSPRLLTNGYYIWTENSFFCDKDGNITLSPSQTSVLYKENLVRIFRKKKRIRRPFSSLFDLSASESWLCDSIFGETDSSPSEDLWLEGVRRLDTHHCNENRGNVDCSLTNDGDLEKSDTEFVKASPSHIESPTSEHFPGNLWDHSKTSLLREISFQVILLLACLIISACARWFLGGTLATVFTCSLMITIAYVVKSLFLSLASYCKDTSCARFAKI
ncbi:PREDICTED: transmembrane protein 71 [Condylura cristata]|uniref:transmembrane protein 71 n=1 Tax=Condylura cristata TaxID=143302 RepID=UPI000643C5CD|nr:PREDICTED: transmembrane protein 71 [Condylura cristata]